MPRCLVTGMIDALCGLTGDDFTQMALDLLPRGLAWPREPGTVLEKFWSVPGDRMSDLHQYGCTFLNQESFPCSAVQLLSDWERVLGLPREPSFDSTKPFRDVVRDSRNWSGRVS